MARRLAQLLVVVAGCAGLLAAAEHYQRCCAWPVAASWYSLSEHDGEWQFRCQNFAPVAFAAEAAPGVTRLLFAGGSTVFGYPERPKGTEPIRRAAHGFPGIVQASLDAASPGAFDVINLGMNGSSSEDTLRVLRRVRHLRFAALVLYDGHNEFMSVPASFSPAGWGFALYRRLMVFAPRRTVSPGPVGPSAYGGPAHARAVAEQFRVNLSATLDLARDAGWPVILFTQASNLAELDPSWSTEGDLGATDVERAWSEAPDSADLAWRVGRRRLVEGGDAGSALRAARDADPLPIRASSAINAQIRAMGSRATVVDAEPHLRSFYDGVHPTPDDAGVLAGLALDALAGLGVVPSGVAPVGPTRTAQTAHDAARLTAGFWLRMACVRQHDPAWRMARAREWAAKLLELSPEEGEGRAMAALAADPSALVHVSPEVRAGLSPIHPCVAARLVD
jgi:lysophospholipase L1-like esterase